MPDSKLKFNPDKREFVVLEHEQLQGKVKFCFPINILGTPLFLTASIRNLRVCFNAGFSFLRLLNSLFRSLPKSWAKNTVGPKKAY